MFYCLKNASVRIARFGTFKAECFEHGDRAAAHVPLPRITMSKSPPQARIFIMPETQHRPQAVARRAAWARCIGALAGTVKHKTTQEIVIFSRAVDCVGGLDLPSRNGGRDLNPYGVGEVVIQGILRVARSGFRRPKRLGNPPNQSLLLSTRPGRACRNGP